MDSELKARLECQDAVLYTILDRQDLLFRAIVDSMVSVNGKPQASKKALEDIKQVQVDFAKGLSDLEVKIRQIADKYGAKLA